MSLSGITKRRKATKIENPAPHSPLTFHNKVEVEVHGPKGLKQRVVDEGNILVTWGLNQLIEQLVSGSDGFAGPWVNVGVLATGTDAIGYSDDALTGATNSVVVGGGSMVASDGGARSLQYNMTFSDEEAYTAGSVGLFGSNVSNASMVAAKVLSTTVAKASADTVNVTYKIIAASA